MRRRDFLTASLGLGALGLLARPVMGRWMVSAMANPATTDLKFDKLVKTKEEWKKLLPADSYRVLFEQGTEFAGSSPLNDEKREGTFVCAACFLPLFDAKTKYNSGTGWPSFYDAIPGRLGTSVDNSVMVFGPRTEYHCARCNGHQGHVFPDGPKPTGLRYCNNGVALRFVPKGETLPALRQ
jgi:peptide-methionine (R)-S-oxide reductase